MTSAGKVRWLRLDGLVISEEIGHAKPSAIAFRWALSAVNGSPASAAMIGDDLDVDVRGALSAGFGRAVWITRRPGSAADRRVAKVRSLRHVLAALGLTLSAGEVEAPQVPSTPARTDLSVRTVDSGSC